MKFVYLGVHGGTCQGYLVRNQNEDKVSLEVTQKVVDQCGSVEEAFSRASRYSGISLEQFTSSGGQLKYSQGGPFDRYICGVVQ